MFEYDSAARRPRAIEEWLDLKAHTSMLRALIVRNVKIRYKRSVFGLLWTLAQPAAMLIVLTLIFTRAFSPHTPFYPAYLGPGLILWFFFSQTTAVVIAEVAAGVDLWRRVRMPKTALAVATTATSLLNLLFTAVPLLLVVAVAGRPLGLSLLTIPIVIALMAMFTLGFALTIAAIALYFPDVADLYQIVLSAWIFVTPVIYPRAILPPAVDRLVALNPLTLYIDAFRRPFYENATASPAAFAMMFAISTGMLLFGWYVFSQRADDIPYRG